MATMLPHQSIDCITIFLYVNNPTKTNQEKKNVTVDNYEHGS